MHALIFPFGSAGDVYPLLGLALQLADRGHRITFFTTGYFGPTVQRVGLDFVELGTREEYLEVVGHPELWHPRRALAYIFRAGVATAMRQQYQHIASRYQPGETVVLSSCLGIGARLAQEKLGVPTVTVHLQPAVLWSEFDSPQLSGMLIGPWAPRWFKRWQYKLGEKLFIDPVGCPIVNAFRAELDLPPVSRITRWWHSPEKLLCLFPDWYGPPQPDWPDAAETTQFPLWEENQHEPLPQELTAFLNAGSPPVVFTPGTGNTQAAEFFDQAVASCRRLQRRGLLLTRFAEQVPRQLPDEVRHVPYAPFGQLLPRCAAIVHHGGVGTTAQAMRAGIPQLVVPLSHDQPDNAMRVIRLGVGDQLPPARFRTAAVAGKLQRLLTSDAVHEDCRRVASRFVGVDPFAQACQAVERFAEQYQEKTG